MDDVEEIGSFLRSTPVHDRLKLLGHERPGLRHGDGQVRHVGGFDRHRLVP
jgi:hypothetical protein